MFHEIVTVQYPHSYEQKSIKIACGNGGQQESLERMMKYEIE